MAGALYWQRDSETKSGWSIYTLHGLIPLEDLSETLSVISVFSKRMPMRVGAGTVFPPSLSGSTPPQVSALFVKIRLSPNF